MSSHVAKSNALPHNFFVWPDYSKCFLGLEVKWTTCKSVAVLLLKFNGFAPNQKHACLLELIFHSYPITKHFVAHRPSAR